MTYVGLGVILFVLAAIERELGMGEVRIWTAFVVGFSMFIYGIISTLRRNMRRP